MEINYIELKKRNSLRRNQPNMSDLRIVLLGTCIAENNKVVKLILNKNMFGTKAPSSDVEEFCERIDGRNITVISTCQLLNPTFNLNTIRQKASVISSPEPQAIIPVLQHSDFSKTQRDRLYSVLNFFGEQTMKRTMILTTDDVPCKPHLKSVRENEFIREISIGCGGGRLPLQTAQRSHILKKMDEMIPRRQSSSDSDDKQLEKQDEGDKARKGKVGDLKIVLLGRSISGNRRVRNLILGKDQRATLLKKHHVQKVSNMVKDRLVTVFNSVHLMNPNTSDQQLMEIVRECSETSDSGPHVFMIILQNEDFTEEDMRRVQYVLSKFSEDAINNTIIITTDKKTESSEINPAISKIISECKGRHLQLDGKENVEWLDEILNRVDMMLKDTPEYSNQLQEEQNRSLDSLRSNEENKHNDDSKPTLSKRSEDILINVTPPEDPETDEAAGLNAGCTAESVNVAPPEDPETDRVAGLGAGCSVESVNVAPPEDPETDRVAGLGAGCSVESVNVTPPEDPETDRAAGLGAGFSVESVNVAPPEDPETDRAAGLGAGCSVESVNVTSPEDPETGRAAGLDAVCTAESVPENIPVNQKLNLVLCGSDGSLKVSVSKLLRGKQITISHSRASREEILKKETTLHGRRINLLVLPALGGLSEDEVTSQTLRCVSFCDPGVHAFLLIIRVGQLTDGDKEEIQKILKKFYSKQHFIIIFVSDGTVNQPAVDFIQSSSECQQLISGCEGLYRVMDLKQQENSRQITELLDYVEKMNTEPYSLEMYVKAQETRARRETEEKYEDKLKRMKKELQKKGQSEDVAHDDLRIVLLGKTGDGKSASGNTILGRIAFNSELKSRSVTRECHKFHTEFNKRRITVIDTPGLFDTGVDNVEAKKEIAKCVSVAAPGPHVFLLVIQLGRVTKEVKDSVKMIQEMFGDQSRTYTIVLFTRGDQLKEQTIKEFIEDNDSLKITVHQCENRYHVFNNETKDQTQVSELLDKIDQMVAKNGGTFYTNEMFQQVEMNIREEQERIMKEKEDETKKKEEEMRKKYEAEIEQMKENNKKEQNKMRDKLRKSKEEFKKKEEEIKKEKDEHQKKEMQRKLEEQQKRFEEENKNKEKDLEEQQEKLKRSWEEKHLKDKQELKERIKQETRQQAEWEYRDKFERELAKALKEAEEKHKKEKEKAIQDAEEKYKIETERILQDAKTEQEEEVLNALKDAAEKHKVDVDSILENVEKKHKAEVDEAFEKARKYPSRKGELAHEWGKKVPVLGAAAGGAFGSIYDIFSHY